MNTPSPSQDYFQQQQLVCAVSAIVWYCLLDNKTFIDAITDEINRRGIHLFQDREDHLLRLGFEMDVIGQNGQPSVMVADNAIQLDEGFVFPEEIPVSPSSFLEEPLAPGSPELTPTSPGAIPSVGPSSGQVRRRSSPSDRSEGTADKRQKLFDPAAYVNGLFEGVDISNSNGMTIKSFHMQCLSPASLVCPLPSISLEQGLAFFQNDGVKTMFLGHRKVKLMEHVFYINVFIIGRMLVRERQVNSYKHFLQHLISDPAIWPTGESANLKYLVQKLKGANRLLHLVKEVGRPMILLPNEVNIIELINHHLGFESIKRAKKFQGTVGPLLQHMNAMQNVGCDKTYKAVISGQLSERILFADVNDWHPISTIKATITSIQEPQEETDLPIAIANRFATVSASSITDPGFENHEVTTTDLHFRMASGATMIKRRLREEDENNSRQDKQRRIDNENDTILSNGIDEEQHENVVEDEDMYEERNDYI
ncbi:hypothetical protein BDB00DRAFT_933275 [Zychaea mexicana]|uniref:uncharacterized protein n=1 Tax=Zychaea mexicana TaxID=64656 RepID=UPI0022FE2460|nr:uncharacterized protein BDB00DRAFT_933275 [Zychaea mexicana]KAI9484985.1 hypothetical protein BDB00DRAFT_933275 [Zychaea mexicana]